jgi:hypothetical protein
VWVRRSWVPQVGLYLLLVLHPAVRPVGRLPCGYLDLTPLVWCTVLLAGPLAGTLLTPSTRNENAPAGGGRDLATLQAERGLVTVRPLYVAGD